MRAEDREDDGGPDRPRDRAGSLVGRVAIRILAGTHLVVAAFATAGYLSALGGHEELELAWTILGAS